MKVDTQRFIDRFIGTIICRLLSLYDRFFRRESKPHEIKNILIILLSEMGALVLAYPMFERLKKKFPDASVQVLLFEKNREVLDLLEVIPPENILTINDKSMSAFIRDTAKALFRIRAVKFDAVIDCELFSRISSILSFLSRGAARVGFHSHTQEGLYRGNFINRPVLYNPYQHISRQFLTLVDAIQSNTHPKAKRMVSNERLAIPALKISKTEVENAQKSLYDMAPGIEGKKVVLIYPGGGLLPIRAWPLDYYCRLTSQLLSRGYAVCVIGLTDDKNVAKVILDHNRNPNCVDLTGYTKTIRQLMTIFHFSSLLITNDGGPGHFAAMTPIPTIVFFGPETPKLYGTMNQNAVNYYLGFSCSPCVTAYNHRKSPCDGDNLCLKEIQPDGVLSKALEILEESEGSGCT
jgi:ADP-heptose:LPS heptosyltransferase